LERYLPLQNVILEAEQQGLAVLGPQMIDASGIDGTHQIFIHLVLGILGTLRTVAEAKSAVKYN